MVGCDAVTAGPRRIVHAGSWVRDPRHVAEVELAERAARTRWQYYGLGPARTFPRERPRCVKFRLALSAKPQASTLRLNTKARHSILSIYPRHSGNDITLFVIDVS